MAAPSLIPKRAGDRIKPVRRDELPPVRLSCDGSLTAVRALAAADEAVRGLLRARDDAV